MLNVLVSVRDKQGKIVHDLTKDDFTLDEAGHPQTIKYFAQQTDMPLTLGPAGGYQREPTART